MSAFRNLTSEIFEDTEDTLLALKLASTLIDNGFVEEPDTTFRELTRAIYRETKDPEKSFNLAGKLVDSGAVPLKTDNVVPLKAATAA